METSASTCVLLAVKYPDTTNSSGLTRTDFYNIPATKTNVALLNNLTSKRKNLYLSIRDNKIENRHNELASSFMLMATLLFDLDQISEGICDDVVEKVLNNLGTLYVRTKPLQYHKFDRKDLREAESGPDYIGLKSRLEDKPEYSMRLRMLLVLWAQLRSLKWWTYKSENPERPQINESGELIHIAGRYCVSISKRSEERRQEVEEEDNRDEKKRRIIELAELYMELPLKQPKSDEDQES